MILISIWIFTCYLCKVCILPAVYATWALVHKSTSPNQFWASLIYGIALIMLFIISTAFHSACYLCNAKNRYSTYLMSVISHNKSVLSGTWLIYNAPYSSTWIAGKWFLYHSSWILTYCIRLRSLNGYTSICMTRL